MPGFAVFSTGLHREPPRTAHARRTEGIADTHRHTALRARWSTALSRPNDDNARRRRGALSLVRAGTFSPTCEHSLRRVREVRGCRGGSHVRRDHVVPRCGRCIHGRPPAARRTHVLPRTVGRPAAAKRHIHVPGTRAGARRGRRAKNKKKKGSKVFTSRHSRSRVQASTRERRSDRSRTDSSYGGDNYKRARINRPRPPTLAVTLMSRQVTRAPHQVARSPPSATLPIKRRRSALHYRGRKRGTVLVTRSLSLSLSFSFSLCPGTASVCVITRDWRTRTRDVHARGYGGETPRTGRVENRGKDRGSRSLVGRPIEGRESERVVTHRASADFQPHYPRNAIIPLPSSTSSRCPRRYLTVATTASLAAMQ